MTKLCKALSLLLLLAVFCFAWCERDQRIREAAEQIAEFCRMDCAVKTADLKTELAVCKATTEARE